MRNFTERQELIPGWDQQRLADADVAVYGRGWRGTFTVCGLASLGCGRITWIGKPSPGTQPLADLLLGPPPHFAATQVFEYPWNIEYGGELASMLSRQRWDMLVVAADTRFEFSCCRDFAAGRKRPWIGAPGDQLTYGKYEPSWSAAGQPEDPIVSLALAAQVVDGVRQTLAPLSDTMLPPEGRLELDACPVTQPALVEQFGVGGIGAWSALALAAAGGTQIALRLVDRDHVEESNRNRQVLYSAEDVRRRTAKAPATQARLRRLFPGTRISSLVHNVGQRDVTRLVRSRRARRVLISALDNAAARLIVQQMGCCAGVPVVHGGTGTFAADCLTQHPGGPTLDQQLLGALTEASQREARPRRPGGCAGDPSYVVPSMMAGALVALRTVQVCQGQQDLPPLRWRTGSSVIPDRRQRDDLDFSQLYSQCIAGAGT